MKLRFVSITLGIALLAACGDDAEVVKDDSDTGEASGEVLGGSISDDMLPLDTLRSQSPQAAPPAGSSNDNGSGQSEPGADPEPQADEAAPGAADPASQPAPALTPQVAPPIEP